MKPHASSAARRDSGWVGVLLVILAVGIAELTARQFPHAYKIMSVAGYLVLGFMLVVWFVAVVRRRGSPGAGPRGPVPDRRWIGRVAISAGYGIIGL